MKRTEAKDNLLNNLLTRSAIGHDPLDRLIGLFKKQDSINVGAFIEKLENHISNGTAAYLLQYFTGRNIKRSITSSRRVFFTDDETVTQSRIGNLGTVAIIRTPDDIFRVIKIGTDDLILYIPDWKQIQWITVLHYFNIPLLCIEEDGYFTPMHLCFSNRVHTDDMSPAHKRLVEQDKSLCTFTHDGYLFTFGEGDSMTYKFRSMFERHDPTDILPYESLMDEASLFYTQMPSVYIKSHYALYDSVPLSSLRRNLMDDYEERLSGHVIEVCMTIDYKDFIMNAFANTINQTYNYFGAEVNIYPLIERTVMGVNEIWHTSGEYEKVYAYFYKYGIEDRRSVFGQFRDYWSEIPNVSNLNDAFDILCDVFSSQSEIIRDMILRLDPR